MKSIVKLTSSLLIASIISACAGVPTFIPGPDEVREKSAARESKPKIGETSTVGTGDNLYSEFNVKLTQPYSVILADDAFGEMDLGHKFKAVRGTRGPLAKTFGNGYKAACWANITTGPLTGPAHGCLVDSKNTGSFDSSMFINRDKLFPLSQTVKYQVVKDPLEVTKSDADFKREILYQGVSKGTIKLSFREYINDMARPAFTQDILYDLDKDGTAVVVFKGLRIKVLEATGASLKYVVQQPFQSES
jgi:hypothetical protein